MIIIIIIIVIIIIRIGISISIIFISIILRRLRQIGFPLPPSWIFRPPPH